MKGEFYRMDFRAWNIGTVDLSLEQEAAYLRLCHAMYDAGGPVPNSTRFLMAIFRCGNVKASALLAQLVAAGKIAVTGDGRLFNHRVSEELAHRETVSKARRQAGERGGSAPRVNAECPPSDGRVTTECRSTESRVDDAKSLVDNDRFEAIATTPRSRGDKIREDTPKAPKGAKDEEPEGFAEWFACYPKRDGVNPRQKAAARYMAARKAGVTIDQLRRAVRAYRTEMQRKGKIGTEFVKQAQFWLSPSDKLWEHYAKQGVAPAEKQPDERDDYLGTLTDDRWRDEVRRWIGTGCSYWPLRNRTEPPDSPRTKVPRHILAEANIHTSQARAA